MRIGLIADSHIPAARPDLPVEVARAFAGVDLILHAGDIYVAQVLDWLSAIAPVYAVPGDGVDHLMMDDARMALKHVLDCEGVSVGLVHLLQLPPMHGEVWPGAIAQGFPRTHSVRRSARNFFGADVDVVVFGDTHYEMIEQHEGVLFVNPGSPTLPRQMMRLGHVGLLDIRDGRVSAQIVALRDYS